MDLGTLLQSKGLERFETASRDNGIDESALAMGLVVVGDLVGSRQAQERGIVGETPNLAARLQGFA